MIILSNLLLVITMICLAVDGWRKGGMNSRRIWVSTFLTLLTMPIFIEISTILLAMIMPHRFALLVSGIISFPVIYSLVELIRFRLIVMVNYKLHRKSKTYCAFLGAIKGFSFFWAGVVIFAASFSDLVVQPAVTTAVKENFTNIAFDYQVDFYRKLTFRTYHLIFDSEIDDLYTYFGISKDQEQNKTMLNELKHDSTATNDSLKNPSYSKYSWRK